MITDAAVLERHAESVRPRCRLELRIVNALLKRATECGYDLRIEEYEGEPTPDLKDALFNLDVANVVVRKRRDNPQPGEKTFQRVGWILLVFGNDGFDLISDYTTNLEEFLKPINELADRLANGAR